MNCAETILDRPGQPAHEMFGIKRRFQRCEAWPPRFKEFSLIVFETARVLDRRKRCMLHFSCVTVYFRRWDTATWCSRACRKHAATQLHHFRFPAQRDLWPDLLPAGTTRWAGRSACWRHRPRDLTAQLSRHASRREFWSRVLLRQPVRRIRSRLVPRGR